MKNVTRFFSIIILSVIAVTGVSAQTSLSTLDGSRVDVEGHNGKVVLLVVGASWMGGISSKQVEYTNSLAKKFAGKNVVVYFVATDPSKAGKNFKSDADLRAFATTNRLTVPVLRDSDAATMSKKYGVEQVPSFVLIDKNGNQSGEVFGGIDPKYDVSISIAKAIDKLL